MNQIIVLLYSITNLKVMLEPYLIEEPALEFGGGGRHLDIRFGLMDHGPFDLSRSEEPKRIKVGIVGSSETIGGTMRWMDRCNKGVPAKSSRQPNLFPAFPGLGAEGLFRCEFVVLSGHRRTLPKRKINTLVNINSPRERICAVAAEFANEIHNLAEQNAPPDVIVCALPLDIILATRVYEREAERNKTNKEEFPDLRGILKAKCMEARIPIQILWPTTYDPKIRIPRKTKIISDLRIQDDATRAWNFFTALYYKAKGLPWRLVRDPQHLKTAYIGISFYRTADGDFIHSSSAQMFDERGEGIVLRGARARESAEDRRPHLDAEAAYDLLSDSLDAFRSQHEHFPARVVLYKTSLFDANERKGFDEILRKRDINHVDFIFLSQTPMRLYRIGPYPPLRGTAMQLDNHQLLLYTRGSVQFFRTYPGMYVPRPLLLRCYEMSQSLEFLAEEVLALSKMNWNNTQFDGGQPITIRAARSVGNILKYVPENQSIAPRYSFYM